MSIDDYTTGEIVQIPTEDETLRLLLEHADMHYVRGDAYMNMLKAAEEALIQGHDIVGYTQTDMRRYVSVFYETRISDTPAQNRIHKMLGIKK